MYYRRRMGTNTNRRRRLSDAVLLARNAKTLTQAEVAALAGVSSQLVSNIERGEIETLRRSTAAMLGRALGVDLSKYIRKSA